MQTELGKKSQKSDNMIENKLWHLYDHTSATGRREARLHYDRSSDEVKAAFDVHWELLEVRARALWTRPAAAKLDPEKKGGFREFFEFRFKADKTQQRPIGFFGPDRSRFTLLIWATEKGSQFVPPGTIDTCGTRRAGVLEKTATVSPWNEDEDDESDEIEAPAKEIVPRRLRQGAR